MAGLSGEEPAENSARIRDCQVQHAKVFQGKSAEDSRTWIARIGLSKSYSGQESIGAVPRAQELSEPTQFHIDVKHEQFHVNPELDGLDCSRSKCQLLPDDHGDKKVLARTNLSHPKIECSQ